jgi:very-short-patch-repair endonuclease
VKSVTTKFFLTKSIVENVQVTTSIMMTVSLMSIINQRYKKIRTYIVCSLVSQGTLLPGIEIRLEPEIWYTSCDFYTPDLVVNNKVIIEVDGPLHEDLKIKKNDRIRQRALENTGYVVYRFKNREIAESLGDVITKIKYILSQSRGVNPKMFEIDVPEGNRMSNISGNFVKEYASALNSTLLTIDRWNAIYFKEFLSRSDPSPISNRCAMEKLIFILLGQNLRSKDYQDEPVIDFKKEKLQR